MQTSKAQKTSKKLGFVKAVTQAVNDSLRYTEIGLIDLGNLSVNTFRRYMEGQITDDNSPMCTAYVNSQTSDSRSRDHDQFFTEYFVSSPKNPARKLRF